MSDDAPHPPPQSDPAPMPGSPASGGPGESSVRTLVGKVLGAYKSDSMAGSLARGASWSFGLQTAALLLAAAVQVTLARVLGDVDYGKYTYVLGWMQVVAVLTVFEFDATAVRFVSLYSSAGNWGLLRGFQRTAFWFTGGLSVAVAAVAAMSIWIMRSRIGGGLAVPGLITCAMLPVATVTLVLSGALQGRKLIARSELAATLRPLIFLILLFAVVGGSGYSLDTVGALGLGWTAAFCTLGLAAWLVRKASVESHAAPPRYRRREWFGMSSGLLPGAFAQLTLGATTDVVIVGTVLGPGYAGIYSIASLLLKPAGIILESVARIACPLIADYYGSGRKNELQRFMTLVVRVSIVLAVPAVLGVYALGPALLAWFGPTFQQGYPVLVLLGLGTMTATVGGIAGYMLAMTGNHHTSSVIIGLSAAFNLVLALILTPRYGMGGAAAATTIATIVRNAALAVAVKRRTGISLTPFSRPARIS